MWTSEADAELSRASLRVSGTSGEDLLSDIHLVESLSLDAHHSNRLRELANNSGFCMVS